MPRTTAAVAPMFGHSVAALLGLPATAVLLFIYFYTEIPEDLLCFIVWTTLIIVSSMLASLSFAYAWHFDVSPQSVGVREDARFLYDAIRRALRARKASRLTRPTLAPTRHAA